MSNGKCETCGGIGGDSRAKCVFCRDGKCNDAACPECGATLTSEVGIGRSSVSGANAIHAPYCPSKGGHDGACLAVDPRAVVDSVWRDKSNGIEHKLLRVTGPQWSCTDWQRTFTCDPILVDDPNWEFVRAPGPAAPTVDARAYRPGSSRGVEAAIHATSDEHFLCPKCGAHHDRGFYLVADQYRCIACGYIGPRRCEYKSWCALTDGHGLDCVPASELPASHGDDFCAECICIAGNGQRGHHMVYAGFDYGTRVATCAFCPHSSNPVAEADAFKPGPAAVAPEPTRERFDADALAHALLKDITWSSSCHKVARDAIQCAYEAGKATR